MNMKIFKCLLWANILALFVMLLALVLSGCKQGKIEYGETLTESAMVYDTAYVPSGHGSDLAIGYNTGKGGGVTITPIDLDIPERYAVVFKCQHGKFVIAGDKGKSLYQKLNKGDAVTVKYCEVFKVDETGRKAIDLHFIDAEKKEATAQ